MRPTTIGLLFITLILGPWGCAHEPDLTDEIRAQLGRVGLVSARYTPAVEFELPAKGRLKGAGRGAVRGTGVLIILVPSFTLVGAFAGASAGAGVDPWMMAAGGVAGGFLGAAVGALTGAGYMIGGPIYGAVAAEPAPAVEEADAELKTAIVDMHVQEEMRNHILEVARPRGNVSLSIVEGDGPETPSDLLTYLPVKDSTLDSILEIRVPFLKLTVMGESIPDLWSRPSRVLKINPLLSFSMEMRARLIRLRDRHVLYDHTWSYTSSARKFLEWAADEGKPFAMEVEQAYYFLAKQLVLTLFI